MVRSSKVSTSGKMRSKEERYAQDMKVVPPNGAKQKSEYFR